MMRMMEGGTCSWGMMAGMGLVFILVIVALVLGIGALIKYLFSKK